MLMKRHEVTREGGAYVVKCISSNGLGGPERTETVGGAYALKIQAEAQAAKLDGRDMPKSVPAATFARLLQETRTRSKLTDAIALACEWVLVRGATWKLAAESCGVTEPGILKGLRAMKVR